MKPDVHRGRVTRIAGVVKFLCELFARGETAVKGEELHQIDDGVPPIELLRSFLVQAVEDRSHVHGGPGAADGAGDGVGAASVAVLTWGEDTAWLAPAGESGVLPNIFDMIVRKILIACSCFTRPIAIEPSAALPSMELDEVYYPLTIQGRIYISREMTPNHL
jgi:hypothetical protein